MAKKRKPKAKDLRGLVIYLNSADRANLRTLQGRIEEIGVDKSMARLTYECFLVGLHSKLANTEKL